MTEGGVWVGNYSGFSIIRTPIIPYLNTWTLAHVTMFLAAAGKKCCDHWSFATGESKAAV